MLGEKSRPDHKWLIVGPARSGSIFHIDQTNAWNVSIKGRKKWIFYPPHINPPGVVSSEDGADVTVPISTGEWLLSFWKFHLEARKDPDITKRPLEAILNPSEVIFVPHGYWHMVINLDDCIALTHNYVSTSNLSDCLKFLREKPDQISGVRDRLVDGAIDPEFFYEEFIEKLKTVVDDKELNEYIVSSYNNSDKSDKKLKILNHNIKHTNKARKKKRTDLSELNIESIITKHEFSFSFNC